MDQGDFTSDPVSESTTDPSVGAIHSLGPHGDPSFLRSCPSGITESEGCLPLPRYGPYGDLGGPPGYGTWRWRPLSSVSGVDCRPSQIRGTPPKVSTATGVKTLLSFRNSQTSSVHVRGLVPATRGGHYVGRGWTRPGRCGNPLWGPGRAKTCTVNLGESSPDRSEPVDPWETPTPAPNPGHRSD